MRTLLALSCLAACGRLGFGDMPVDDGGEPAPGDGSSDAGGGTTGPAGPRWLKVFGAPSNATLLAGANGALSAAQEFQTSFTADDGIALSGNGYISTAVARYRADGSLQDTHVLDATGFCAMRGLTVIGTSTIAAGYTQGTSMPAYGACSITTNRQDPIALEIDAAGTQTLRAHWIAGGTNAQAWSIVPLADGTFAMSGIYGADLTAGSAITTAQADPNGWLARTAAGSASGATWAKGLSAPNEVHGGPVAASGMTTYALGAFNANMTLLGTALSDQGSYDSWLARIDGDGTVAWVRSIGSPAAEPSYGNSSTLVTLDDGTLVVGLYTTGDVTYGGTLFAASGGPGLVLHLDATGALLGGMRLPSTPHVAAIGSRVFAALDVSSPLMIGGTLYTPQGGDSVVVELGPTAPTQLVGALTGAGTQSVDSLVAIGPDALALGGTSLGALTFGSTTTDSGMTSKRVIATLGL